MSTPRLSVSTWSLHRQLGKPGFTGPAHDMQIPIETHNKGPIPLLELPARVAEFGINTLEICHFHLPSVEKTYLAELRAALAAADVELFSLLIDDGDITHPLTQHATSHGLKSGSTSLANSVRRVHVSLAVKPTHPQKP